VAMMWDFASYGKYHVVGFETLKWWWLQSKGDKKKELFMFWALFIEALLLMICCFWLRYGIPVGVWISLLQRQRDLHRLKHIGIDSQNTLRVGCVFALSCYTPKLNWLKRALYHNNKVHNTLVHKKMLGSPVSLYSPISCFSHF
jgi:hypothetical protein